MSPLSGGLAARFFIMKSLGLGLASTIRMFLRFITNVPNLKEGPKSLEEMISGQPLF